MERTDGQKLLELYSQYKEYCVEESNYLDKNNSDNKSGFMRTICYEGFEVFASFRNLDLSRAEREGDDEILAAVRLIKKDIFSHLFSLASRGVLRSDLVAKYLKLTDITEVKQLDQPPVIFAEELPDED